MKLKLSVLLAAVAAVAALAIAPSALGGPAPAGAKLSAAQGSGTASACRGAAKPARWHHVVWIWMENKGYKEIIGSASSPYVNALAAHCGLATNYRAITYPSLPNYLAATSGSTHGVTDDALPAAHRISGPSIFSQVGGWRSLQHSMPTNCDRSNAYPYMVKHNPAAYYTSIRTQCRRQDTPLARTPSFAAPFTFITPNMCEDSHDCTSRTGDAWLAQFIPKLLTSRQYAAGDTLLVLTFDSDDHHSGNHVATVLVAPSIARGTRSGTAYTHYSLLRTTEELLGKPLLGRAASAPSMRRGFGL